MILCPNCLHKEMTGAMFCSECGAQLVFPTGVPTGTLRPTTSGLYPSQASAAASPAKPPAAADAIITLVLVNSGDTIPVASGKNVTLGRMTEGQRTAPDIDLSPYKAYEAGVSRIHAIIRTAEDQITVTDLGSANGTRINGRQISPHLPYPIKHGDILTLGKFKIQISLSNQS